MNKENRYKDSIIVTVASSVVNVLLTVAKIIIGILTASAGLIAEAIHSISDFATDVIVIVAMKLAKKKADEKHPFDHNKIEAIASFILGLILLYVGIVNVAYENILKIIDWFKGEPIEFTTNAIFWVVVAISILSKEILYQVTVRIGKKYNNQSVIANAWHHRSDAMGAVAVLLGALVSEIFGFKVADRFAALIVSGLIIKVGLNIVLEAGNMLIDVSAGKKVNDEIRQITLNTDGVSHIDSLKTRLVSNGIFVYLEISVDSNISVCEGHNIAENLKKRINEHFDNIKDIMVHVEPTSETNV